MWQNVNTDANIEMFVLFQLKFTLYCGISFILNQTNMVFRMKFSSYYTHNRNRVNIFQSNVMFFKHITYIPILLCLDKWNCSEYKYKIETYFLILFMKKRYRFLNSKTYLKIHLHTLGKISGCVKTSIHVYERFFN